MSIRSLSLYYNRLVSVLAADIIAETVQSNNLRHKEEVTQLRELRNMDMEVSNKRAKEQETAIAGLRGEIEGYKNALKARNADAALASSQLATARETIRRLRLELDKLKKPVTVVPEGQRSESTVIETVGGASETQGVGTFEEDEVDEGSGHPSALDEMREKSITKESPTAERVRDAIASVGG